MAVCQSPGDPLISDVTFWSICQRRISELERWARYLLNISSGILGSSPRVLGCSATAVLTRALRNSSSLLTISGIRADPSTDLRTLSGPSLIFANRYSDLIVSLLYF